MPPSHDPTVFLWALGAAVSLAVLALGAFLLTRGRRAPVVAADEARAAEAKARAAADQSRARAAEAKAKADFEQAVKEGKLLPDGRTPCQASATCGAPAMHPPPAVARDAGVGDFVRRRFGAPERYRMVEDREPLWIQALALLGIVVSHPRRAPQYCDVHIHVARQVCQAQLARDEQEVQAQRRGREVALATFEARGMLAEVQALVRAAEEPPARERKPRSRRQPSKDIAPVTTPSPARTNGSNGTHLSKGAFS